MNIVQMILDNPRFGAVLHAGMQTMDTRPECRTVHICETPDPTPWLRGGELVLTTGILLEGSEELQETFVRGLHANGCTAVGYSGYTPGWVPMHMVKIAQEVGLPLFTIEYSIPLTEVLTFAMERVLDRINEGFLAALALQTAIMTGVSGPGGMLEILERTADALPEGAIFVCDFGGNRLREVDRGGMLSQIDDADMRAMWLLPELSAGLVSSPARATLASGCHATLWPIRLRGELEGVVIRLGRTPLNNEQEVVLAQGVIGAAFVLSHEGSVRLNTRERVEELIESLAVNADTQVVSDRLDRLGFSASDRFSVTCLQAKGELPPATCRRVEAALQGRNRIRIGTRGSRVYVVAGDEAVDPHEIQLALKSINKFGISSEHSERHRLVKLCTSPLHVGIEGLRTAFWQVHSAVSWDTRESGVVEMTDLNVAAIFAASDPTVRGLVLERILGPLLERDRRDDSSLLETLSCFLKHGCRPGRAAAELFIHRHTLAYRLDRIAELTGRDPRDGAHLLDLTLAVALTRLDTDLQREP